MDFNFENGLWLINTFTGFEGLKKGFNILYIISVMTLDENIIKKYHIFIHRYHS